MSMCPCYIPLTNITNMINDTCLYCKGSLANIVHGHNSLLFWSHWCLLVD